MNSVLARTGHSQGGLDPMLDNNGTYVVIHLHAAHDGSVPNRIPRQEERAASCPVINPFKISQHSLFLRE